MLFTDISEFKAGDLITNCTGIVYRVDEIITAKVKKDIIPVKSVIVNIETNFTHEVKWYQSKFFELFKN